MDKGNDSNGSIVLEQKENSFKQIGEFLINNSIIIILLILTILAAIMNPKFLSFENIKSLGINSSIRLLIAVGVSGCLITKGTDLSAGRMIGLGSCIAGTLLQVAGYSGKYFPQLGDVNIVLVLLLSVSVCALFGFFNGVVISKLKVPPFIATLGMQTIVYGICLLYTKSTPLGNYRKEYTSIATSRFLGIPIFIIIGLIVGLFIWFLFNKTTFGKYMYAIGGNEQAAEVSGVNVSSTLIKIYMLAGALYGLTGFLLGAKAGGATVNLGQGYELEAIAACTIGGVSTTGGVGRVSGILLGVFVFEIMKSAMQFLGVNPSWQYIVQGLVIIIAVAIDVRKYIAKK